MSNKSEASKVESIQAPDVNPKPNIAKRFTGSDHEKFSSILMGQICNALWLCNSSEEERKTQSVACLEALVGIAPKDESEGMLAAQMLACHNAAMECFRRAMIKEQPFAGRQQNLKFRQQAHTHLCAGHGGPRQAPGQGTALLHPQLRHVPIVTQPVIIPSLQLIFILSQSPCMSGLQEHDPKSGVHVKCVAVAAAAGGDHSR